MITYEWRPRLDGAELDEVIELVTTAAEYDDEAGFSHIDPTTVREVGDAGRTVAHLPIKARRDLSPLKDAPMVIVAYLHLAVDADGLGTVSYVVHPEYRSRGITTLLVEEIGLETDGADGWDHTGAKALRCWAYSTHPASGRLTRRFGIPTVSRQWTLVRHLTGPFALPLDKPEVPSGLAVVGPREHAADDQVVAGVLASAELAPRHRDRVADDLRLGGGLIVDARNADGEVLGFVWFSTEQRRHLELRAAPVDALVLTSAARGGGVGTALLLSALWHQLDAGVQVSTLRIDPDDAGAVRMCRLLGYEQEDVHSCYQLGESSSPPPAFR
ncbi:GNAT family N-acetyltransferase [Gordonia alkanivorans]|uniref:GNAT family N-acetyltransferase n=1 Tax=Gordonia alkanivorans TaxID=84096 RepID=UPI00244AA038|nr:GNAT family N-acetyltransferase [Gordonia alkanivorans]MDH3047735.1 GNAT family N-acetyltransferase [Gordonia alkanivorans]